MLHRRRQHRHNAAVYPTVCVPIWQNSGALAPTPTPCEIPKPASLGIHSDAQECQSQGNIVLKTLSEFS